MTGGCPASCEIVQRPRRHLRKKPNPHPQASPRGRSPRAQHRPVALPLPPPGHWQMPPCVGHPQGLGPEPLPRRQPSLSLWPVLQTSTHHHVRSAGPWVPTRDQMRPGLALTLTLRGSGLCPAWLVPNLPFPPCSSRQGRPGLERPPLPPATSPPSQLRTIHLQLLRAHSCPRELGEGPPPQPQFSPSGLQCLGFFCSF